MNSWKSAFRTTLFMSTWMIISGFLTWVSLPHLFPHTDTLSVIMDGLSWGIQAGFIAPLVLSTMFLCSFVCFLGSIGMQRISFKTYRVLMKDFFNTEDPYMLGRRFLAARLREAREAKKVSQEKLIQIEATMRWSSGHDAVDAELHQLMAAVGDETDRRKLDWVKRLGVTPASLRQKNQMLQLLYGKQREAEEARLRPEKRRLGLEQTLMQWVSRQVPMLPDVKVRLDRSKTLPFSEAKAELVAITALQRSEYQSVSKSLDRARHLVQQSAS